MAFPRIDSDQMPLFPTLRERQRANEARSRSNRRETLRTASQTQYEKGRQIIEDAKRDRPCVDCGGTFPTYVMDFDHVRGVKRGTVSSLVRFINGPLQEEIAKCDLVCANCHRIRTMARGWPGGKNVGRRRVSH